MKVINLQGQEGNAFALMGIAKTWCRQLGLDSQDLLDDMMSGDYEHLKNVFKEKFEGTVDFIFVNDEGEEIE